MIDTFKEIWQTMRTNKLRTFLTGFSVAWGILMLIVLLAIANGVIRESNRNFATSDSNRISIWSGRTSLPYKGLKVGRSIDLRVSDLDAVAASSPGKVTHASSSIYMSSTVSTSRDYLTGTSISGMFPDKITPDYVILSGRKINDADIKAQRKAIMLPKESANILFGSYEQALGKTVKAANLAFTVVGVYENEWDTDCIIPFSTAYALSGYKSNIYSIDAHFENVATQEQSAQVEQNVREALAKTEKFDPNDKSAVYTYDRFAGRIQSQKALNILNYTMWIIGLLTLITGIVGVSNIMFVSVRERTHEIGIRRAIGAKPRNILTQVVLESVVLTTVFGYIGIVLGTLITEIVKKALEGGDMPMEPTVDLGIAIEVTIALIIAGALAGIFPAMRAIKVRPVEALHDE